MSDFASVPVIDVSSLLADLSAAQPLSAAALSVCAALHRCCVEVSPL